MENHFEEQLLTVIDEERVRRNEPLRRHTTFRVGGPADYLVMPVKAEEIKGVIQLCHKEGVPYYILGNGSNLLVGDKGYRGVMMKFHQSLNRLRVEGNVIRAEAGCSLAQIAVTALEAGLTGFEFAAGIPGTLGGAVVMNAGAYGGEMKDVLRSATVLTRDGDILELPLAELEMGYRTSIISRKDYIVLEARISLQRGEREEIRAKMEDLRKRRVEKQPLEYPSAGSTFKRPEGYFAGKLIQDAGLRGARIGGAQVSEKHCGFVINTGDATAADIVNLIRHVADTVKEKFGVTLEPEVKRIGEF